MTPAEILRAAKEKISDPATWHQGALAANASGSTVEPLHSSACRWCAEGAFIAITKEPHGCGIAWDLLVNAAREGDPENRPCDLNDTGTHADVMAMFDRAIAEAESQELSGARSVE